jgi:outer membrane protein assembly factor BamB
MTYSSGQQASTPTVLAVSRYGTFWLLEAQTGTVRWQLLNGSRSRVIDHGGEMIYVTYFSGPIRRDTGKPPLRSEQPSFPSATPEEVLRYHDLLVTQAELLALRSEDGSIAWRQAGWVPSNERLPIVHGGHRLDGDLVISSVTDFADETPVVSALDARTGAVRWTYRGARALEPGQTQPAIQLQGACAGRVYVYNANESHLDVLDTSSGDLVWSCPQKESEWYLSPGGERLAEVARGPDPHLVIRRTLDGRISAGLSVSPEKTLLGLTDTGIAYLDGGPDWHKRVEALDTNTGETKWHAERHVPPFYTGKDIGLFTDNPVVSGNSLYFARYNQSSGLAEVLAFDTQAGKQRWYWHSPSHIMALLMLWGWRTPHVIMFALSQFRRRLRSQWQRVGKPSLGSRLQSIWHIIRWDILAGQWLRPQNVLSTCFSVATDRDGSPAEDGLYVGTSMGLSALRGSDHRRLWHELLMMEITEIIPEERHLSHRREQPAPPVGAASGAEAP